MPAKKNKIAIVADDHQVMCEALAAILTNRLGFADAITVGSLEEAVEQLEATPRVQLALFDLQMPGVKNAATIGALTKAFPNTKIAIVSGSSHPADIEMALQAGIHGYIPKGLSSSDIAGAVTSILDGSIFVPPGMDELKSSEVGDSSQPKFRPTQGQPRFTRRQLEVLDPLVKGMTNKEISRELQMGFGTVKVHVAAILQGLNVTNRASARKVGSQFLQANMDSGQANSAA
jgi:DNA-binding NarL/FixJ family response regulator